MEYKFRGKSKRDNEWVFGSLVELDERKFIVGSHKGWLYRCYSKSVRNLDVKDAWEVHPESVGQWTGLSDEVAVEIFSGDIMQGQYEDGTQWTMNFEIGLCGCHFGLVNLGGKNLSKAISDYGPHIKVIGNATDNPELLKENSNEQ